MGASPTLPGNGGINPNSAWKTLLEFLSAGIGQDRPLVFLGKASVLADANGEQVTIPAGATMVKFFVAPGAGNVYGRLNSAGAADNTDYEYVGGQEYIEGPFTTAITHLNFVRVSVDTRVYCKFYKQG